MRIEHVAWQVADPPAVAAWWVEHLGFTIARQLDAAPYTCFLTDATGAVMVEFYNNPIAPVPDYASMHHLVLHLAFEVDDPAATREQLLAAGATVDSELETIPSGDQILMMRDPFGFCIQFVCRKEPMVRRWE